MNVALIQTVKNELLESFYRSLRQAEERLLLLDYDGTLAPFRVDRNKAVLNPDVRKSLNRILKEQHSRIVIISGRWTTDLIPLLALDGLPEIWGSHGIERLRPDGTYEILELDKKALQGLVKANAWINQNGLDSRIEEKPGCLALHWRGLDAKTIREMHDKVMKKWTSISQEAHLSVHEFDGGIELRVSGFDKGNAVETILSEVNGNVAAAYLGDDLTDEDAFKAIQGSGLGILVREEFRPTAASIWLKPPGEMLQFLDEWDRACRASGEIYY